MEKYKSCIPEFRVKSNEEASELEIALKRIDDSLTMGAGKCLASIKKVDEQIKITPDMTPPEGIGFQVGETRIYATQKGVRITTAENTYMIEYKDTKQNDS